MVAVRVMGPRSVVVCLCCLLPARLALAQTDTVAAESLFQQGRSLLEARKFDEACPKLKESLRLDPATGTLLALALCHEAQGKLASAWAEFTDAAGRARGEGRKDREDVANQHANALYPRLSALTIEVAPDAAAIPGLEVRRDGVLLGRGAWGSSVPIDGGEHVVDVTAPGMQPWQGKLSVQKEREPARLAVPALVPVPASAPVVAVAPVAEPIVAAPVAPSASAPPPERDRGGSGFSTLQWAGAGTALAGAATAGVGGYFLLAALDSKSASKDHCDPANYCDDKGFTARDTAVFRGNVATVLSIAGGVLVAGGVTLFFVGRSSSHAAAAGQPLALGVAFAPDGAAARLQGAF